MQQLICRAYLHLTEGGHFFILRSWMRGEGRQDRAAGSQLLSHCQNTTFVVMMIVMRITIVMVMMVMVMVMTINAKSIKKTLLLPDPQTCVSHIAVSWTQIEINGFWVTRTHSSTLVWSSIYPSFANTLYNIFTTSICTLHCVDNAWSPFSFLV